MSIGSIPYLVFPSMGSAYSSYQGGRVSLPVNPAAYIYSHFEHVSGVLAPEGVQGVSINKLKILDSLISEIVRLNKQPKPDFAAAGEDMEKRFAAIVENLQRQIQAARKEAARSPDLGMMFNISA